MAAKLVIYDGSCPYCTSLVRLLHALDRKRTFSVIPFDAQPALELLRAQFGDGYGLSLYVFERDGGRVSWGAEGARTIVQTLSFSRLLARIAFRAYPTLVRLVSTLTGRTRAVCGPGCVGSDNPRGNQEQGSTALLEKAEPKLAALLQNEAL